MSEFSGRLIPGNDAVLHECHNLKMSIAQEEKDTAIIDTSQHTKTLRTWAPAVTEFADLPHEVLMLVLELLGYAHQQRLVRVCKLWKTAMTHELAHVSLDPDTFYFWRRAKSGVKLHILKADFRTARFDNAQTATVPTAAVAPWKYNLPSVRRLIFNGQYTTHYSRVSVDVLSLVELRFPRVTQVIFRQVIMQQGDCCGCADCTDYNTVQMRTLLTAYFARLPRAIALKDCVIRVVPEFSPLSDSHGAGVVAAKRLLGRHHGSYVSVPDVTWRSVDEVLGYYACTASSQLAWSYPDEQLEWLARWAPCLNGYEQMLSVFCSDWLFAAISITTCEEHSKLCEHLNLSFHRQLSGQGRNFLAICLLELKPAGLAPPPVPFRFGTLQFCEGKPARFDLIA